LFLSLSFFLFSSYQITLCLPISMKPSFLSPKEVRSAISRQSSSSKPSETSSGGSASMRRPSPLLGGAGIREPSPLFGRSGAPQPSPTVDLMAEATDACAASHWPSSFLFAPVQNNGVPEDISTSVASSTADDSGIALGCNTPSDFGNNMPIKEMAICKDEKKGQDKGVGNYTVQEHLLLLQIMSSNPSSFNVSESSPEWREVHLEMCKQFYFHWGSAPRLSST
jgi:hypothetical protein